MTSSSNPTIDLSKISFPISIDSASLYTAEAIQVFFLGEAKHPAETQVFDAVTVSRKDQPDCIDNPSSNELEIIHSSWQLAGLSFPLKGAPMDDINVEIYEQAFINYVYDLNWSIEIIRMDWQVYQEIYMREVHDQHRVLLKEKISDRNINPLSGSTLRLLGKDGWHPNNLLLESDFSLFCDFLKIKTFHESNLNSAEKTEPTDFFEKLSLLTTTQKDLALYDRFTLTGGKISGKKVVSKGSHLKEYALKLDKDVRTIKNMLLRGMNERSHDGNYVHLIAKKK